MTSIPHRPGLSEGTIIVRVEDVQEWERRWQETRDTQMQRMNNLLETIDRLNARVRDLSVEVSRLKAALKGSEQSRLACEQKLAAIQEGK